MASHIYGKRHSAISEKALRQMDKDTGGWKLATEVGYPGDVNWDDSIFVASLICFRGSLLLVSFYLLLTPFLLKLSQISSL